MESSKEIIGKWIKFYRLKKNMTPLQLAALLGVDRQYVWKLENGKVNITVNYLDKIILSLNCRHADFLK